jgi:HSP20 family protein
MLVRQPPQKGEQAPIQKEKAMANITRFDPFEELARFRPLGDFDDFFKGFRMRPLVTEAGIEPRIKVDVSEADAAYSVKAEIPGVKKEDIHVAIDGNQVSIEAEVKKEKEEKKGEKVVRSERYYGKQSRSFTLGYDIDAGKAEAKYADGVLELKLPKKSNGSSKELKVQ